MHIGLFSVSAILFVGCIVKAPGSQGDLPGSVSLPEKPLSFHSGAIFDGKIQLVGASFSPGSVSSTRPTRAVAVFKVLAPIESDFSIFVHIESGGSSTSRVNADHPPRRPTSSWKVGETIQDEFTIALPVGASLGVLTLWVGFWQPGSQGRMRLSNGFSVENDGNDRVLLARLPLNKF